MKAIDAFVKAGIPDARLKATQFEDFVVRGLLPLAGGHIFLASILRQDDTHPETAGACAIAAAAVGAVVLEARATRDGSGILAAIGASSVLTGATLALPAWAASTAIAIAVIGYAAAVGRDRIRETGAALFFLHVPFVSHVTVGSGAIPVSVTLTALLVAFAMLVRRRVAFAGAALTGGLFATILETKLERAPFYVAAFVVLLAVGAMVFELRREGKRQSPVRRAAAQSLGVLLLWVLGGLMTGWDAGGAAFVWLLLVILVQGVLMLIERGKDPIRPIWAAVALVVVCWATKDLGDWRLRAALNCVAVAALYLHALRVRSRFVAVVAAALLIVPAAAAFDQTDPGFLDPAGFAVQILITLSLLAQGIDPRAPWRREFRWWRGFIPRAHWRTLTELSILAARTVEGTAVIGGIYRGVRAVIGWVRYLNGGIPFRLHDITYVAAHVYGAWAFGNQMTALAPTLSAPAAALTGQLAWMVWAFGVLLYGEIRDDVLSRYVGLVLVCVPAATDAGVRAGSTDAFALWLLAATGAALSAYAAARFRRPSADITPTSV